MESGAQVGTHVINEPNIKAQLGVNTSLPKWDRSRGDVGVRTADGRSLYIVDVTIVDATLSLKPNKPYKMGEGTEEAFCTKVAEHTERFPDSDVAKNLRVGNCDLRGGLGKGFLAYLKELNAREHRNNKHIRKSVIASRNYQRISVAIQRCVAYNVAEYRYWRVPVAAPAARAESLPVAAAAAGGLMMGEGAAGGHNDAPLARGLRLSGAARAGSGISVRRPVVQVGLRIGMSESAHATPANVSAGTGISSTGTASASGSSGGVSARSGSQATPVGGTGEGGALDP